MRSRPTDTGRRCRRTWRPSWPVRRSSRGACSTRPVLRPPAPTRSSARESEGCWCHWRADYLVRDFAADLGLPLAVAASPGLGTINHALLTIEAARSAGLEITAVVLTPWPEEPGRIEESNRETIAKLGEVAVEALPRLDLGSPSSWPPLALPPGRPAPNRRG